MPILASASRTRSLGELFEKSELEVCFLARQGDYWLTYDWGGERVVEAFTTKAERSAAMKDIEEEGGENLSSRSADFDGHNQQRPLRVLCRQDARHPQQERVSQQVKDQVIQLFVDALPETSLIRALQKRKNRLGAIEDTSVAFRQKGHSLAREIIASSMQTSCAQFRTPLRPNLNPAKNY